MTDRRLPSERTRPGDPRRVGFQMNPSEEHFERSAAAAQLVATLVSMPQPAEARPLRVCLCHVQLAPRLPFELYGFHINGVDEHGDFTDDLDEDGEVLYALVANQPVEIQLEASLAFLNDLIGRQGPLTDIAGDRRGIGDLPDMTAAADAASAEAASDTLRFGIDHAAKALITRAAAGGYRLEVRYQLDPLPRWNDVARRVGLLRQLYDTEDDVRSAVDRTISILGGSPLVLRGGSELVRAWTQQHTALLGVRQFLNQCARDADVCGNGYLEFGFIGLDPKMSCLKPEDVEIVGRERFMVHDGGTPREARDVMHLPGLEQIESPYGISPWEPLLHVLHRQQTVGEAGEEARKALASGQVSEQLRAHAEDVIRVVEAVDRDTKERMEKLLWFPRRMLPEPRGDLYFSGQERFAS